MSLCPEAWRIVIDGRVPFKTTPPKIIEECGKKKHNILLREVERTLRRIALHYKPEEQAKVSFHARIGDEWREIIVKPDGYLLYNVDHIGPVNIVVEVTTRSPQMTPVEWLAAYGIAYYLQNLRPTFILLARPDEIGILPHSTRLVNKLHQLLTRPPTSKPKPWICSNCDLRPVCTSPYY